MALALSPTDKIEFVLERERDLDTAEQSVFIFNPLTIQDEAWITNCATSMNGLPLGDAMERLVRTRLVGARNFKTEDGVSIEMRHEKGRLSEEAYRAIARLDRIEMTYWLIGHNKEAPVLVEKSESQSTSSTPTSKPDVLPAETTTE